LVAHLPWEQGVACSNHVAPTTYKFSIDGTLRPSIFVYDIRL
jgi:hypothetical protein